jgi:protein gp37
MSDGTKIEWTDATWNPITGCSVVSAGCKNCYAMKLAGTRLQHHPSRAGLTVETSNGPVWNGQVRFNEQWIDQPLKWKRPRRIFVCAHGDLFHESVPDEWIDQVFAVMALAPQHTFQVLTKRPKRMRQYLSEAGTPMRVVHAATRINSTLAADWWADCGAYNEEPLPLPNVWLGVSVENQDAANKRIPLLLETPAAVRWISAEPLLGPVDLARIDIGGHSEIYPLRGTTGCEDYDGNPLPPLPRLDWVVAGGESGINARPMHPSWARGLRDQCNEAGVAFLFKQWGEYAEDGQHGLATGLFEPVRAHKFQNGVIVERIGKKAAGRMLDGRTWDEYPEVGA